MRMKLIFPALLVPVLVACSASLSRSLCIAAAGIALAENRPLAEILTTVAGSGPADISPGLLTQLGQALRSQEAGSTPEAKPGAAAETGPWAFPGHDSPSTGRRWAGSFGEPWVG